MSLLFRNEVRNAVVKVIDSRIDEAQKSYDESSKQLAEEVFEQIKQIKDKHEVEKELLLKDCVASVLRV
jgi:hypothetical protein